MPKISVIIPTYNVEKYLEACLDSVLAQTFEDWEAICVNDGSTDNCENILNNYAKKDNRIKIITQTNQGLSTTRNNGVKQAQGEYILFLDSDDLIHNQLLEICYTLAQKERAEMVSFCFKKYEAETHTKDYEPNKIAYKTTNTPLFYQKRKCKWKVDIKSCTKFYKKTLIENLSFIPNITYEDYPHTYSVLKKHPRCVLTELPLYFYRTNPNSISNKPLTTLNIQDYACGLKHIMETYETAPKKEKNFIIKELIPNILKQQYNRIKKTPLEDQEELIREFTCTLHIIKTKGFLKPYGHKITRYLTYKKLLQTENPLRKFIVKTFCLFFCAPKYRQKLRRMLMKQPPLHVLKTYYNYKRKQPKYFKHNLSITICVKDEGPYLKEWIEYYLLQGVNHFYIYNNNGTDNSKEIIMPYINKGIVTWHEFPGKMKQEPIYNHSIEHYKNETKWMAFVDADEFIVPLKNNSVAEFLSSFQKATQICIPWVMYGSSGHNKKPDGLVIECFTKHQEGFSTTVKSIVNPRAVVYAQVHHHLVFGPTMDENKNTFKKLPQPTSANIICCNHYFSKSYEEFCLKKNKGRAAICGALTQDDFSHDNFNDVEDNVMEKYVDIIKKRVEI